MFIIVYIIYYNRSTNGAIRKMFYNRFINSTALITYDWDPNPRNITMLAYPYTAAPALYIGVMGYVQDDFFPGYTGKNVSQSQVRAMIVCW